MFGLWFSLKIHGLQIGAPVTAVVGKLFRYVGTPGVSCLKQKSEPADRGCRSVSVEKVVILSTLIHVSG